MLVVGMLIALGLVYRFNTAFRKYTIDMYGTYYRCLLEAGELPGVGAVCSDKKSRFDMANGTTLVTNTPGSAGTGGPGGGGSGGGGSGSGGSGGGGSGGGGGGSGGNQAGGGRGGAGSGSSDGGGSGSNGSDETVGGSSQGSGGGSGSVVGRLRNLGRARSTAVGTTGTSDKEAGDKASGAPPISAAGSRASGDGLKAVRTKMDFQMDGQQYSRAETAMVTATTASASSAKPAEKGDALRPRKAVENTDRKPAGKQLEDKGGGLEFGKLFRMFIIIGIIIAIVVFLGGQVLQISKSGEK